MSDIVPGIFARVNVNCGAGAAGDIVKIESTADSECNIRTKLGIFLVRIHKDCFTALSPEEQVAQALMWEDKWVGGWDFGKEEFTINFWYPKNKIVSNGY